MNNSVFVPSGVTVKGTPGQTILKKSASVESKLVEDADYGDSVFAVAEPQKFQPGMGVAFSDDQSNSGWDITVSTVTAVRPPYITVDPMTLRDYIGERKHGTVRNTFPILCVVDAENVVLEDVIVDGNRRRTRTSTAAAAGQFTCTACAMWKCGGRRRAIGTATASRSRSRTA